MRKLECFGGPLCGSKVPDTQELWMAVASIKNHNDQHYYKRVKLFDMKRGTSLLTWQYHGTDPDLPGARPIRPHPRKFR